MGLEQRRLWAFRNNSEEPIFHFADTGVPALFSTRKHAELWQKRLDVEYNCKVEIIEVEIIERKP